MEAQKSTENDIIEKQIVCEDKTIEDPGQASVARIETTTVTEEVRLLLILLSNFALNNLLRKCNWKCNSLFFGNLKQKEFYSMGDKYMRSAKVLLIS